MERPDVGKPRGILRPELGKQKFRLFRYVPSSNLEAFVEHYWIVEWDLRDQEPYVTETLPHPSVHVVFEEGQSEVVGVMRGKFSRHLQDEGRVFGVKFTPGGFYPLLRKPVVSLTDATFPVHEVFGVDGKRLERGILTARDHGQMVEYAETFLRSRLSDRDEAIESISRIVYSIIEDRTVAKVDDLVARLGVNKRWLQRTFSRFVGVSPKWVIQRYRLHEAAEQLTTGGVVDWTQLALDLGYFDQAHFIKDFKTVVGVSPAEYIQNGGL